VKVNTVLLAPVVGELSYIFLGYCVHPLGSCQVAVVLEVAVSICPVVGAAEELTLTVVVADFRAFALLLVLPL